MNLPNKLTILRIILTPVFLLLLILEFPHHTLIALLVFIFASVTDMIDGNYARSHNMVTNFGKFLDPLADKMLTTAAFLGFMQLKIGYGIIWITFIILFREFLVSSIRLVAVSSSGKVIAANIYGKIKTVTQMVGVIFGLTVSYLTFLDQTYFNCVLKNLNIIFVLNITVSVILWASAVLTVISGIIYLLKNKKLIDSKQ